jgi:alginate O-acetyltransferase complex protein AlgI
MTFISLSYGLFLLCVIALYWLVRHQRLRLWIILIASVVFYASIQWQYIPLLFVLILINFRLGQAIGKNKSQKRSDANWQNSNQDWPFIETDGNRRQKLLFLGIIINVFLLLGFKYVPFILNSIGQLLNLPILQQQANSIGANIIAPLGISFFCFECIAYLIDVYRGAPPTQQFDKFAAYKLFFPKLISGPITRYHHLAGQLNLLQFPNTEQIVEGLWLIACGAVKKALIADRLGILVSLSFDNLQRAGSGDIWLATLAYGLQLYLDFSAYVDIARGSALLLGLNLPQNFDFPYLSTSIADFWRRWHITLGDWLRNYLYFPLGGSRRGLPRTCINLLIVMLIAGIWHGAAWGFIIWGGLHGFALVVHRITEAISSRISPLKTWWVSVPGIIFAWLLTQGMVFTCWIFFRLPNLQEAGWAIQHLWGHQGDVQFAQKVYVEAMGLDGIQIALLLGILVGVMGVVFAFQRLLKLQINWPVKLLLVPISLYAVWLFAPQEVLPYIYFDF